MNRFERWSVWVSTILVAVSGAGLLWVKYFVHNDDPWSVINHPLQPWFLKAHILTAPLLIAALGQIALRHVWRHFHSAVACGRRSGVITAAVSLPLILSGYLIQVITSEAWLELLAVSHIILGVVFAIGILIHSVLVRRLRPRSPAADRSHHAWLDGSAGSPAERAEALSGHGGTAGWGAGGAEGD